MNIDADFPQKVKNFYRITFLVDYYRNGNIYRLGSTTANYFVFTTDSSEVHLSFYVGNIDKNLEWRNMKLYLDHITEDYYDFQQACKTQRDNDDSIFNTDGTEIPSNVNGGYGIFTFITRDTACINLK
jgi:hypothetical protein